MITKRERQVAELTTWGASMKEIASQLGISEKTARNHTHNLLQKLEERNKADIARRWMEYYYNIDLGPSPRTAYHTPFPRITDILTISKAA